MGVRSAIPCARCGYDLSGAVAAWERSCPIGGVCSECGYRFEWGRTLARVSGTELGLYEVAQALAPYAFARSVALAVRPRTLWREAVCGEPLRVRRLLLIGSVGFVAYHLVVTLVFQIVALAIAASGYGGWGHTEHWAELAFAYLVSPLGLGVMIWSGLMCALMLVVSRVVDSDRFRTVDVARACAYWFATVPLLAGAAELAAMIELDSLVSQLRGRQRMLLRDALAAAPGLLLSAMYGWMWFWWASAFRLYFDVENPRLRSFLATGGVLLAALAIMALITGLAGALLDALP